MIHHVPGPCRDRTTKDPLSPFILTLFPHSSVWTGVDLCLETNWRRTLAAAATVDAFAQMRLYLIYHSLLIRMPITDVTVSQLSSVINKPASGRLLLSELINRGLNDNSNLKR